MLRLGIREHVQPASHCWWFHKSRLHLPNPALPVSAWLIDEKKYQVSKRLPNNDWK